MILHRATRSYIHFLQFLSYLPIRVCFCPLLRFFNVDICRATSQRRFGWILLFITQPPSLLPSLHILRIPSISPLPVCIPPFLFCYILFLPSLPSVLSHFLPVPSFLSHSSFLFLSHDISFLHLFHSSFLTPHLSLFVFPSFFFYFLLFLPPPLPSSFFSSPSSFLFFLTRRQLRLFLKPPLPFLLPPLPPPLVCSPSFSLSFLDFSPFFSSSLLLSLPFFLHLFILPFSFFFLL